MLSGRRRRLNRRAPNATTRGAYFARPAPTVAGDPPGTTDSGAGRPLHPGRYSGDPGHCGLPSAVSNLRPPADPTPGGSGIARPPASLHRSSAAPVSGLFTEHLVGGEGGPYVRGGADQGARDGTTAGVRGGVGRRTSALRGFRAPRAGNAAAHPTYGMRRCTCTRHGDRC